MDSSVYEVVRNEEVVPSGIVAETRELGPMDVLGQMDETYLAWPIFLDYRIEVVRLIEAVKKLCVVYPILCGRLKPDPERRYVLEVTPENARIPFSEVKSDISIASAILDYSRLQADHANYHFHPDLPFFTERLDYASITKGEAALMKIRLTELQDGCALNMTVSHTLCDADRLVELYRDLGRAYQGQEIPERNFDRSWMWPDQLVKHYTFLGDEIAQLPRTCSQQRENAGLEQIPGETSRMELIYLPKETLTAMKASLQPFLAEGEFVSTNDVLVGLAWMLRSELEAEIDLKPDSPGPKVSNTQAIASLDLIKNGLDFIPSNAFGNVILLVPLCTAGMDLDEKPRTEILATLAGIQRKSITAFRENPATAAQALLLIYNIVHTGVNPVTGRFVMMISNYTKTPLESVDFGKGSPKMMHFIPPSPYLGNQVVVAPAPGHDEGTLLHLSLLGSRYERLKRSQVLKELAPGAKLLYSDVTHDAFNAMLQS